MGLQGYLYNGTLADMDSYKSQSLSQSVRHAVRGIGYAFMNGKNLRLQLIVFILVLLLSFFLELSAVEVAVVIVISALVLTMEFFNSALESLADAVHPGKNPLIGYAKDIAAAGVLIASLAAFVTGCFLFLPKIW